MIRSFPENKKVTWDRFFKKQDKKFMETGMWMSVSLNSINGCGHPAQSCCENTQVIVQKYLRFRRRYWKKNKESKLYFIKWLLCTNHWVKYIYIYFVIILKVRLIFFTVLLKVSYVYTSNYYFRVHWRLER